MKRIYIPLLADEREALLVLARSKRRDPRQQAALLIRQSLERAGLIEPHKTARPTTIKGVQRGS